MTVSEKLILANNFLRKFKTKKTVQLDNKEINLFVHNCCESNFKEVESEEDYRLYFKTTLCGRV